MGSLTASAIAVLDRMTRPKRYKRRPKGRAVSWFLAFWVVRLAAVLLFVISGVGVLVAGLLIFLPPSSFSRFDARAFNDYWGPLFNAHYAMVTGTTLDPQERRAKAISVMRAAGRPHTGGYTAEHQYRDAIDVLLNLSAEQNDIPLMFKISKRAIVFDPNDSFAWYYYGRALLAKARLKEAEEALVKAHAIRPFSPQITKLLADLHDSGGRPELAVAVRRRQVEAIHFCLAAVRSNLTVELIGKGKRKTLARPLGPCNASPIQVGSDFEVLTMVVTLPPLTSADVRYSDIAVVIGNAMQRQINVPAIASLAEPASENRATTSIPADAPIGASPVLKFDFGQKPIPAGARLSFTMTLCPSAELSGQVTNIAGVP